MENRTSRVILGTLLLFAGVIFLLMTLEILVFDLTVLWIAIFGLVGLGFIVAFFHNREEWWPVIPGLALLGLASLLAISEYRPELADSLGPAVFLGAIGLSFWVIYSSSRTREWWAIIPGGVLLTLALVVLVSPTFEGEGVGGIFMLGIGLTFVLLYLLPNPEGRLTWALIPAGILMLIGVLLLAAAVELMAYIWPFLLIVVGLFLILKALMNR